MADTRTHAASSLPEALTEREQEILACLFEGLSNQEIADQLYLSVKTVRWYNSQIYSKLGVNNRQAALTVAEELGLIETLSPAATYPEAQTNLPLQTTPFIGREQELDELGRLLAEPDIRLITVLAPGGMGKTRLAVAAANRQLRHFTDGVFYVPLAAVNTHTEIATAIADSVGFSFSSGPAPEKQLLDSLRDHTMLLVLDNFEHLLDGAQLVTTIIQAAPNVTILATSREKLKLSGETVFTLGGLHVPEWETLEDALDFDAVKLFMQSAHRVRPDFTLDKDDLDPVVRICRLTAGMPLGIVLAAGWVDLLSLAQIATEIQQSLDILETEMRDVPQRQRSIRATFNYSWSRLSRAEQDIFLRLSIFRGGFTAESAQIVAGADLRQLRVLVDKALIQVAASERYGVHELLRQHAEEELWQAGKAEAVQQAHGAYFLDFLTHRKAELMAHRTETTLAVKSEFENIYRAWLWAVEHREVEAIRQTADCLFEATSGSNLIWEAKELFQRAVVALAPEPDAVPHPAWDHVALISEWLRMILSKDSGDIQFIESILARARQRDDQPLMGRSLFLLAQCCQRAGKFDRSLVYCQQALQLWREQDEPIQVSNVLIYMNISLLHLGRPQEAQACLEECIAIRRRLNQWASLPNPLMALARSQIHNGRLSQAQDYLDEAIAIRNEHGVPQAWDRILFLQALLQVLRGNLTDADTLLTAMQQLARETRKALDRVAALKMAGILASLRGEEETLHALSSSFESPLSDLAIMNFLAWSEALVHCTLGDDAETKGVLYVSFVEAEKINSLTLKQISLPIAAVLAARNGEATRAVELLGLAYSVQVGLTGWIARWQLLNELRADLEAELGEAGYAAVREQGARLDLEAIVAQLMREYGEH